jgi:hypothetical protein
LLLGNARPTDSWSFGRAKGGEGEHERSSGSFPPHFAEGKSGVVNRDGSYNLCLDALPVNGKLHMREVDHSPLDSERS